MTRCQSSSLRLRNGASGRMAALFTTITTGPSSDWTWADIRLTSSACPTSPSKAIARTPQARASAATASAAGALARVLTATSQPRAASSSAMARPMLRPPPVTSATRPLRVIRRGGPRYGPPLPPALAVPRPSRGPSRSRPGRNVSSPPGSAARRGQRVQARAVVPEDLGFGLVAHALEAHELVDRRREQAVRVRVVGRDDDVVVAHGVDHLA